jgi:diacylglycerol O-acyltransferase / trehalose O-mycolyltransferase
MSHITKLVLVVLAIIALALVPIGRPATVAAQGPQWPMDAAADDGAQLTDVDVVARYMVDLTIDSPALGRKAKVRLLLPDKWDTQPHRRWPVLYLLHGCCDTYESWVRSTDVEDIPELRRVLVVMPEAGEVGFYSNWWNYGNHGPPAWETFHLTELRQILERGWRAGERRAIAGLSMGGLGTMAYAARHPGLFRAAASYSGVLHTRYNRETEQAFMGLVAEFGFDPLRLWGDPVKQVNIWKAHNPYDLAEQLRGTKLFVSSGNGQPGPLDPPGTEVDGTEQFLFPENKAFVKRLHRLEIPVVVDFYGPGTHDWPYWERELHRSLPLLLRALGV